MSSNIIHPLPKYSVLPSENLKKASGDLDDIEAPKDSVLKRMAVEQGLYLQVDMIRRKDLYNETKWIRPRNTTSRGTLQDQNAGLILIMSG